MTRSFFRPGLLGLGLAAGLTAAAHAQPAPQRQVVRWPGGWMYLDAPGVICFDGNPPAPGTVAGTLNLVADSANGVGNRVVIDTGDAPGLTVLRNVRNGVGNRVTVTPAGPVIDLSAKPAAKKP